MFKKKSDEGLSYIAIYLDVLHFILTIYNAVHIKIPFFAYGESVFLVLQSLIIVFLAWKYAKKKASFLEKFSFLLISNALIYASINMKINESQWELIAKTNFGLFAVSLCSQILFSLIKKSTGPLSAFTHLVFLLGCVGKMLGIYLGEHLINYYDLAMNAVIALLNFVLIFLIYHYCDSKKEKKEKVKLE
jgi:hypothetical protein